MRALLICTGNQGKLIELRSMLPASLDLFTLSDAGLPNDLPETGDTLEENALEKARYGHHYSGFTSIADDSGLEVIALNGAPGVRSARFAGDQKDDNANMRELLRRLDGITDRRASFRTVIALVANNGEWTFEGKISGTITDLPRGDQGFGYDPIFVPDGHDRTFAEMDPLAKNSISHRAGAITKLVEWLGREPLT